jgi:hypothetical protein
MTVDRAVWENSQRQAFRSFSKWGYPILILSPFLQIICATVLDIGTLSFGEFLRWCAPLMAVVLAEYIVPFIEGFRIERSVFKAHGTKAFDASISFYDDHLIWKTSFNEITIPYGEIKRVGKTKKLYIVATKKYGINISRKGFVKGKPEDCYEFILRKTGRKKK